MDHPAAAPPLASSPAPAAARTGSSITVGAVLETAHLDLELLAGERGLGRRVSFSHVSELPEAADWLDGGELLMTSGIGVPRGAAAQLRYVDSLFERRAAGLAIGVRHPPLSRALLRRADELGFPLLFVPRHVPFLAISHLIADANQHAAQRRLTTHVRIFDTLRRRDGVPPTAAVLLAELEEISGYRLALLSPSGRPIFDGTRADDIDPSELPTLGGDHALIAGGYAVAVPAGPRLAGHLVARERPNLEPAGLSAVRHIATVAALLVADRYREREAQRRVGAELLAELLSGRLSSDEALDRLEDFGLRRDEPLVLLGLRGGGDEVDDDEVHHLLSDAALAHLLLRVDELFVLMPDEPDVLERLASALPATIGVSAPLTSPGNLAVARREVLWAAARADERDGRRVVRFGQEEQFAHWLPTDPNALRQMVDDTLLVIEEYDAKHSTSLLLSLATFFRHERRLAEAAAELYVHKQTLAYRLRRIEELTGRRLGSLQDQAELWLALKALPVVRGRDGAPRV